MNSKWCGCLLLLLSLARSLISALPLLRSSLFSRSRAPCALALVRAYIYARSHIIYNISSSWQLYIYMCVYYTAITAYNVHRQQPPMHIYYYSSSALLLFYYLSKVVVAMPRMLRAFRFVCFLLLL